MFDHFKIIFFVQQFFAKKMLADIYPLTFFLGGWMDLEILHPVTSLVPIKNK